MRCSRIGRLEDFRI
ncbi:hypothetical protein CRE_21978 [Caenorhabditis remanei]|uniref:Uncharacterized protein n=1 Tax=Caenorhabditis remanei TaxID=31234 RepID=E3N3E3_CAERE|nr:hypothetical protein CRE_21978 [Caenorhabditis remanei]